MNGLGSAEKPTRGASRRPRRGFTLIELLVVIAILALLLSILMPSLSKAKHLAKLAVCLANMHHLGMSVNMYAADNGSWYPHRPGTWMRYPHAVCNAYGGDDRPALRPYLNINGLLNCPLAPATIDLEYACDSVYTSYAMFWSFNFNYDFSSGPEEKAKRNMQRVGDPQVINYTEPSQYAGREFRVLASDWICWLDTEYHSSHPWEGALSIVQQPPTYTNNLISIWRGVLGPESVNYLWDDGSARTVQVDEDSLVKIPKNNWRWYWPGQYLLLPRPD